MHITWACTESAQSLSHFVHLVSHASHGTSLSLVTCHPCSCAFLLEFDFLLFYFHLSIPVFFFFPPPALRAVLWARQPDRHAKPEHLREQSEWRRLRRPHLPHRLLAQHHGLQRAQRLFRFLLQHYPVIGPGHRTWMTWHSASCSQRHTEDKPITVIQNACQSVSRRLLSSIEQGNLREKDMSINQLVLVSRETRTVLTASFLKTPKQRKWSIEQGNLMSEIARAHRLGLYLKTDDYRGILRESRSSRNPSSSCRRRTPNSTSRIMATAIGISWSSWIKSYRDGWIRKIPKVLLSIRSQDGSSSKTRTLFWNYQAEYRNCKNEVNCMNDSKDFQDAESVRSGNSHVTSRAVSFPPHPIPEGIQSRSIWNAEPQRGAAKHLGHAWFLGKRCCKSTCIFISSLSWRIESMECVNRGAASYVYSGEEWKTRTKPRSEMQVWTVSQRFSHLQWMRFFKELWGRPTTTADFGSSFWQVPYASNLRLLEDKVQDRGMYLFTISYGSNAVDQGSGVGWFSGRIEIIVIYSWYFNAEFWSTWCEDCFSPEQDHPKFPFQ